jgi:hypothetical protein
MADQKCTLPTDLEGKRASGRWEALKVKPKGRAEIHRYTPANDDERTGEQGDYPRREQLCV